MTTHKVGHYSFKWTSQHMSKEEAEPLKHTYDELGSYVVTKLQEIAQRNKNSGGGPVPPPCQMDLYGLLRDHRHEDERLAQFWEETHTVPEWVDWEQIERGQKFLYRYAPGNLMGFALQGFMGENTAAPGISEVLIRTGGFSTRTLLRRLLETFQFLLQVTESLDAVKPGGTGHITTIRVRLLHSMVRERIMRIEKTRGNYFDMEELGAPVNTIGSIHSITTFSCNHSWLQLPFMGVYPTEQETTDYIALFRYIAHVIGTPTQYFETTARAKATMESMLVHQFRLNETSDVVAHNFVQTLTDLPPMNVSSQFIEAGSRAFNGDDLCDKIGLGRPSWYSYACFRGFCWLVSALAFLQHASPMLDEYITEFFKRTLHDVVIHSKNGLAGGSKLEFKHVPQYGKTVGKEGHERSPPSSGSFIARRPVEAFLFACFALGCLLFVAVLLLMSKAVGLLYMNSAQDQMRIIHESHSFV